MFPPGEPPPRQSDTEDGTTQPIESVGDALRAASEEEDDLEIPAPFRLIRDPKKRQYLVAQCTTPSKRMACLIADVNPRTLWNWENRARNRPDDPEYKGFLEAQAVAKELSIDSAESEAWERGTVGWKEPVFGNISEPVEIEKADGKGTRIVWRQRTGVVGEITKKSDTMLIFMLKGAKPETYRERYEHTGPDGAPLQLQIVLPDNGRTRRLPEGE